MIVVVMGVSGSGKSTIGRLLAKARHCKFFDADQFHSPDNKAKMSSGIPLSDEDRLPWLSELHALLSSSERKNESVVLACSSLRNAYRDILASGLHSVRFVFLKADFQVIEERVLQRKHAFMNAGLLESQFETLEEPDDALVVDASQPIDAVLKEIEAGLIQ